MLRDRGKIKWQGFYMPEQIALLKKADRDSQKQSRPELDTLQIEEMEILLQESLEHGQVLEITTWMEGFFHQRVGTVERLNPINKKIKFTDERGGTFNLSFYSITNLARLYL